MSAKAEPRSGGSGKSLVVIALTLGIGYLLLGDAFKNIGQGSASSSSSRRDGEAGGAGGERHGVYAPTGGGAGADGAARPGTRTRV
jgi:hypothetical protein